MLEKQYSRIIRWVHRAQAMSADGNFSDAILDVECARAELDDARQELLLCHKSGVEQKRCMGFKLSLLTALCFILFAATPLQMPALIDKGTIPARTNVTEAAETVPQSQCFSGSPVLISQRGNAAAFSDENKAASLPEPQKIETSGRLSEKDVYRLVEVGRKALRQNKSSIVLELN